MHQEQIPKAICQLCKVASGKYVKPWSMYICKECFLTANIKTLERGAAECREQKYINEEKI